MRLGKDKQAIVLVVFLLFSASAGGQAGKNFKYQFNGNLQNSFVSTEGNSLIINYSISELNVENISSEHGTFYRVSVPGHTPSTSLGKPEVPISVQLISIPEGADYKVNISEVRSSRVKPSGKKITGMLFPAQESESKAIAKWSLIFKTVKTSVKKIFAPYYSLCYHCNVLR